MHEEGHLGELPERCPQQSCAGVAVPALDEQYALEAPSRHTILLLRMLNREIEEQLHVAVGDHEITDIKRDRTRRVVKRDQDRVQVVLRASVIDDALRNPPRLISESLQPQNPRVEAMARHSRVKLVAEDVGSVRGYEGRVDHRLDVSPRRGL